MNKIGLILIILISFTETNAQDNMRYSCRYSTTSHRLLRLEEKYSKLLAVEKNSFYDPMYQKIDLLIDSAKIRLKKIISKDSIIPYDIALKILATIDSILTEQYFLVCIKVEKLSDALTSKSRKDFKCVEYLQGYRSEFVKIHPTSKYYGIDCDLGAFLYLSIGEMLKLPLYVVEVPGHNFIRWQFPDKTYINWDNNSGKSYSDDAFRQGDTPTISKSFTPKEERLNHFLTNLSQNDITGYYLSIIAIELSHQGRYSETEQLYLQAIAYRPYDALSSNNLSWMYVTVAQFKNAEIYQKAYKLSVKVDSLAPKEIEYRDTYSCACAAIGKFNEAIIIEKKARNKVKRIEGYKLKKSCLDLGERIW